MNNSCANPCFGCNCDANDYEWREDSGLLTDKTKLSVIQRVHGDAGKDNQGYQADIEIFSLVTDCIFQV